MKNSRRFRHIDYFQIREGIKSSWKFATKPLVQSQAWIAMSFPKNRYTTKNQHCSNLEFFKPMKKSRRFRHIDYFQIREGIASSWKFTTERLTQSQAWLASNFPKNRHATKNQHYSNLEFFNRIGHFVLDWIWSLLLTAGSIGQCNT